MSLVRCRYLNLVFFTQIPTWQHFEKVSVDLEVLENHFIEMFPGNNYLQTTKQYFGALYSVGVMSFMAI